MNRADFNTRVRERVEQKRVQQRPNVPRQPTAEDIRKREINLYLAGAIDDCWHDAEPMGEISFTKKYVRCPKCGWDHVDDHHPDYFSEVGFFKLWSWVKAQEWWPDFLMSLEYTPHPEVDNGFAWNPLFVFDHIDVDRFPQTLHDFLKSERVIFGKAASAAREVE